MLTGTGLGNDFLFAHKLGQQCLTNGVVDLVRTGVVQVFTLQINLRTTTMGGQSLGQIQRRRTADIMGQVFIESGLKIGIVTQFFVGCFQLIKRSAQGFRNKAAAMNTKMATRIRQVEIKRIVGRHSTPH